MNSDEVENILGEKVTKMEPLGGGCIANTQKITTESGRVLVVKQAKDACLKEANGLLELQKAGAIRIPNVVFKANDLIILEFIRTGNSNSGFFDAFGKALALLHQFRNEKFGFYEDNYIGSNLQINTPESTNWLDFYFEKRLLFQYKLSEKNGYVDEGFRSLFQNIEKRLPEILAGSEEHPALIHGDLWSGNFMIGPNGEPVLIDPAVYYGHREAELAMTRLFGGFSQAFYDAYCRTYPLKPGYEFRENVYTLYHVLNHLNLFGSGYRHQAVLLMEKYKIS